MKLQPITSLSNPHWLRMRVALWPGTCEQDHVAEMRTFLAEPDRFAQFLATTDTGEALGFAEASLRTDYVNGTDSSPVGYLEGIYVEPAARRMGVARALVTTVARWVKGKGCLELASDTHLENHASQAAHIALGFTEAERIVHYTMPLSDTNAA